MENKQTNKPFDSLRSGQANLSAFRPPRFILIIPALCIVFLAAGYFAFSHKTALKDAEAACAALPTPGLSYVGSCAANSAQGCKCNAGETIMLPQDFNFQSVCTVFNQGNNSVKGTGNWDGCTYSCFK